MQGSFRRAVAVAAVLVMASLVGMALTLTVGLARADQLLDRLSRSQDQLAQVTRIEADINGMLAAAGEGYRTDRQLAASAAAIEAELRTYRSSIGTEAALIGSAKAAKAQQAGEAYNGEALTKVFSSLAVDLLDPDPASRQAARSRIEAGRVLFAEMAGRVVARERQEVRQTFAEMRRLRGRFTWIGLSIPLVIGLVGLAAAWVLMARLARPLRELEAAADRADIEGVSSPIEVQGFAEFRSLAQAFNRMADWTRAQDAGLTLGALSLDLRTREARLGGQTLALPRREFELLRRLAENPGASIARHELLDRVWGDAADVTDNLVDVYVGYLRRRLAAFPEAPRIETVRGVGFRIVAS